jgi:predicted nuclease with TOPRIM domain
MKLCEATAYIKGRTEKRHETLVIYDDYFGSESKGECPLCAAMDRIEELETEKVKLEEERDNLQDQVDAHESDAVDINEQADLTD